MNKKIFLFLYSMAEKNKLIGNISVIGTKLSYYVFLLIFVSFGAYIIYGGVSSHDFIRLIKYFLIPLVVYVLNSSMRRLFKKERPFSELGKKSLIEHKKSYSFPSNHAASAMVISVAVIYALNGLGLIGYGVLFLAFLTGLSRVMTGVHYPADVIFGWYVGGFLGILGFFYL